jgi:anti-anti-sigma regulatory factor
MTLVELPADLGIESSTDLKQLLQPQLGQAGELKLDGSAVSRLHCASLQLLAAFVIARQQAGNPTRLDCSPALAQAIGLLGLDTLLDAGAAPSPSLH